MYSNQPSEHREPENQIHLNTGLYSVRISNGNRATDYAAFHDGLYDYHSQTGCFSQDFK